MPIAVICPGCKAQFRVSEKFAGQKGPCPKCKAVIEIPKTEEVVIHAPEVEASAKGVSGRPIAQPILREETPVTTRLIAGVVTAAALFFAAAYFGGEIVVKNVPLRGAGLLFVAVPASALGYFILRDRELQPFRGRELWLRSALCAAGYAALWGVYYLLALYVFPKQMETYMWLIVIPSFFAVGAAISLACLDLDYGVGIFHYGLYVLISLALGMTAGLPAIWATAVQTAS